MSRKTRHEKQGRARAIPIQVYVSEREHDSLQRLTQQRDVSVSDLVRAWIRRAIAASGPKTSAPRKDRRQVEMFGSGEAQP